MRAYVAMTLLFACSSKSEAPASASAASAAPPLAPIAKASEAPKGLRCGDLLTSADVKALGGDASRYDENKTQADPNMGVHCDLGDMGLTFFHGKHFPTIIRGMRRGIEKGDLKAGEGPSVGKESAWSSMGNYHQLIFLDRDGKYAADVTGTDVALVAKIGSGIEAKLAAK